MNIECLVLSGGGHVGFIELGQLYYLEEQKIWDKTKIKSIYGTSAGAILACLMSLNLDWETINDYMIKRPWDKICEVKMENILNIVDTKGIYGEEIFIQFLKPLLDAVDYSIDITLEEFYNKTNIELNFMSFNITIYESIAVNYLNFPDIPLYKALHMSCGIPLLFKPVEWKGNIYIDGGVETNYPIENALLNYKEENILSLKFIYNKLNYVVNKDTSILNYFFSIFMYSILKNNELNKTFKYEIIYDNEEDIQTSKIFDCVLFIEKRQLLFDKGKENAKIFVENNK
jgi:predicted patatin/cPLA2 family phospholipase